MASRYEVEVTLSSARDLKNVNWRNGRLRAYGVVWVDSNNKCSSQVDEGGDTDPVWDETLYVPLPPGVYIEDATLYVEVVHAGREKDTKPLVGSAQLRLRDVVDEVGIGERARRTLQLRRPSGRPQGKLEVKVTVRELRRPAAPEPYYGSPYGVSRDYSYAAPPPSQPYYAAAPTAAYPAYEASTVPQPASYSQAVPAYGQTGPAYGQPQPGYAPAADNKKSKFGGMGTGLAIGAVAGALGGLALAEGFEHLEDEIADEAAEKVEDDLAGGDW